MQFNEKLTSLRKSMGLSQEELGAELKVSRQTISKWESAQSYPDFQRLVLLSDYFGLTLDELVRDVDVADVRAKNLSSEKLDSIYNDVGQVVSHHSPFKKCGHLDSISWASHRSSVQRCGGAFGAAVLCPARCLCLVASSQKAPEGPSKGFPRLFLRELRHRYWRRYRLVFN